MGTEIETGLSKTEIAKKHLSDLGMFRKDILDPLYRQVVDGDIKEAKLLADIIKIYQECERKAYDYSNDGNSGYAYEVSYEE